MAKHLAQLPRPQNRVLAVPWIGSLKESVACFLIVVTVILLPVSATTAAIWLLLGSPRLGVAVGLAAFGAGVGVVRNGVKMWGLYPRPTQRVARGGTAR